MTLKHTKLLIYDAEMEKIDCAPKAKLRRHGVKKFLTLLRKNSIGLLRARLEHAQKA